MTDSTHRTNAVFLTAIVVLSMIAMTATFSGTPAAQPAVNNADVVFSDQDTLGDSVLVDQVTAEGFGEGDGAGVVLGVWNGSVDEPDTLLGTFGEDSTEIISEDGENFFVELDEEIEESQTLVASVHNVSDTDEDLTPDNLVASDSATIRFVEQYDEIDDTENTPRIWGGNYIVINGDYKLGEDYDVFEASVQDGEYFANNFVREVRATTEGQIIIPTSMIESGVYITENTTTNISTGQGPLDLEGLPSFELVDQEFEVKDVSESSVEGASFTIGEIDSNRAGYDLAVTAVDEAGNEFDVGTLVDLGDFEENVEIEHNLTSGDYTLRFDVTDTTASDSTTHTVYEPLEVPDELTYEFAIPNDGDTYSVGIPGQITGTLADIIEPNAEGYTVFVWEDGEWTQVTDFESKNFEPLDAFVVATEGADDQPEEFTVQVEFEEQQTANPPEKELEEGWNFVAAPKFGDADTVFGLDDAFLVLDRFALSEPQLVQKVDDFEEHYISADSNDVSPFKGYFIFVEDDIILPGVLSGAETREDIEEQLDIVIEHPEIDD